MTFFHEICFLCSSHTLDVREIKKRLSLKFTDKYYENIIIGSQKVNLFYICLLLRIADLLDVDADRAPEIDYYFSNVKNKAVNKPYWDLNRAIVNLEKLVKCTSECVHCTRDVCINTRKQVILNFSPAVSKEETPHEYTDILDKVKTYIDYLEMTIREVVSESLLIGAQYRINIDDRVLLNKTSESEHLLHLAFDYNTVIDLLLGEKVYGDRKIGLREIIQNSIDACKYRKTVEEKQLTNHFPYVPKILVLIERNKRKLVIRDNGIGMDYETVVNYFLRIGKSLYTSLEFLSSRNRFSHAGYYGIGFFAAFMLSNNVRVRTYKRQDAQEIIEIHLSKKSEYVNCDIKAYSMDFGEYGTEIELDLDTVFSVFSDKKAIKAYVEYFFLNNVAENRDIAVEILDCCDGKFNSEICHKQSLDNNIRDTLPCIRYDISYQLVDTECIIKETAWKKANFYFYNGEAFEKCAFSKLSTFSKLFYFSFYALDCSNERIEVILLVPNNEISDTINAFRYDIADSQVLVSVGQQYIYNSISIDEICCDNGFLISQYPFIAYKGVFEVMCISEYVFYLQKNKEIVNMNLVGNAIKSGSPLCDVVYVRNVRIPDAHLTIPYVLQGVNDILSKDFIGLAVNIALDGVIPTITRNDLEDCIKSDCSNAIGVALLREKCKHAAIPNEVVEELIEKCYSSHKPEISFLHKQFRISS